MEQPQQFQETVANRFLSNLLTVSFLLSRRVRRAFLKEVRDFAQGNFACSRSPGQRSGLLASASPPLGDRDTHTRASAHARTHRHGERQATTPLSLARELRLLALPSRARALSQRTTTTTTDNPSRTTTASDRRPPEGARSLVDRGAREERKGERDRVDVLPPVLVAGVPEGVRGGPLRLPGKPSPRRAPLRGPSGGVQPEEEEGAKGEEGRQLHGDGAGRRAPDAAEPEEEGQEQEEGQGIGTQIQLGAWGKRRQTREPVGRERLPQVPAIGGPPHAERDHPGRRASRGEPVGRHGRAEKDAQPRLLAATSVY